MVKTNEKSDNLPVVFLKNNPYPFTFVGYDAFNGRPMLFGDFSNGFFGARGWIESDANWADIYVIRGDGQRFYVGDEVEYGYFYDYTPDDAVWKTVRGTIIKFWFIQEGNTIGQMPATIAVLSEGGEVNISELTVIKCIMPPINYLDDPEVRKFGDFGE